MDALIRAAGGVVWRGPRAGRLVAIVHRPRYDDWTIPKGKLKRGEHPLVAACREVWEETGIRPRVGSRLPTVTYCAVTASGYADKTVDYWAMEVAEDDGFVPGDETDRLTWLSIRDALARLSYPRDVTVLSAFAALPALAPPLVLTAPGAAVPPVELLRCFGPTRLVAADLPRCRAALAPLAAATGLDIDVDASLGGADAALLTAGRGAATVVCAPIGVVRAAIAGWTGKRPRGYGAWAVSAPARAGRTPVLVSALDA